MITPIEPQVEESGRYSISATAKALGLHRNTIREYTNYGLLKCGYRRENGRKFYTGFEIKRFWKAKY